MRSAWIGVGPQQQQAGLPFRTMLKLSGPVKRVVVRVRRRALGACAQPFTASAQTPVTNFTLGSQRTVQQAAHLPGRHLHAHLHGLGGKHGGGDLAKGRTLRHCSTVQFSTHVRSSRVLCTQSTGAAACGQPTSQAAHAHAPANAPQSWPCLAGKLSTPPKGLRRRRKSPPPRRTTPGWQLQPL